MSPRITGRSLDGMLGIAMRMSIATFVGRLSARLTPVRRSSSLRRGEVRGGDGRWGDMVGDLVAGLVFRLREGPFEGVSPGFVSCCPLFVSSRFLSEKGGTIYQWLFSRGALVTAFTPDLGYGGAGKGGRGAAAVVDINDCTVGFLVFK